ncbi:MAG: MYXO-CTERM sorting domain-containing protein [Nannocystaceae bacterium]
MALQRTMKTLSSRRRIAITTTLTLAASFAWADGARADEPIALRDAFSGAIDFAIVGASMAADTDDDNKVDAPAQPATAPVSGLPAGAGLIAARLYWAASIQPSMCADAAKLDDSVDFSPPGQASEPVTADGCYCSIGAMSYDMQVCFAEVTERIVDLEGDYTVDGLDALLDDGDTHNASFGLVLIYEAEGADPRRIALYDGLTTMVKNSNPITTVTLDGIEVDDPPQADLAWYVLEGDVNANMDEYVTVEGTPNGGVYTPTDAVNPANNPFNQTINTFEPAKTGTIGVDIDRFDVSPALAAGDSAVEVVYSADLDKYWIAVNVVGVDVFEPALLPGSGKGWALTEDAAANGEPTPGDTVTYTITLENAGNAAGVVSLSDPIPAEAASWAAGELCGGALVDKADAFEVTDIPLAVGESCGLTFTVVVGEVADETPMDNTATATLGNGIDTPLVAPTATLRSDVDGDGVFDNDDNCPEDANEDQADADDDGIGDACEGETTGAETSGTSGTSGTTGGDASTGSDAGTSDSGSGTGGVDTTTGGATGVTDGGAGSSAGQESASGSGGGGIDDGGCGCVASGGSGAPWWALVGVSALVLRRRRR